MRHLFLITLLLFSVSLSAQKKLEGFWEGTLTLKGKEYRFEVLLKLVGKGQLEGKTYIYESDRDIVEATISGQFHQDRSMNLYDLEVSYTGPSEWVEVYHKHYQLVYRPSIFGSTLEGHWQEKVPKGIDEKTKIGRIKMKKLKENPDKV